MLELSPEEVVERSLKALQNMDTNIGSYDVEAGLIEARTAMNWRTFGDVMLVRVSAVDANQTTLIIESDSPLPSVLYDFGSNARNIKRFEQELFRDDGQSSERPAT